MHLKGIYTVNEYIDQGPFYPNMSFAEVDEAYNGVGPEWMPEHLRELLDKMFHVFRDAVIIHDCDYAMGLTEEDKKAADERFLRNCRKLAWRHIQWWKHPLKLLEALSAARILYLFVRDFGDTAFWKGKTRP